MIIHSGSLQRFLDVYRKHLEAAVNRYPDQYAWNIAEIDTVFERMSKAIECGTFNKDSQAFKATCKELGIKHTYKAIKEFISL